MADRIPRHYDIPYLARAPRLRETAPVTDVDLNTVTSWGRVASAYDSPSLTGWNQRVFLFGLVVARRPQRVFEIGFRYGGTSLVILSALQDNESGRLVALDPDPEPALDFARFGDMFQLYKGRSPDDVGAAARLLGGPIDLCHIDGDHSYRAVLADLHAVVPHMGPNSYILMHDAAWSDVARAIRVFLKPRSFDFLRRSRRRVVDCGLIDPFPNAEGWGGMQLLHVE